MNYAVGFCYAIAVACFLAAAVLLVRRNRA